MTTHTTTTALALSLVFWVCLLAAPLQVAGQQQTRELLGCFQVTGVAAFPNAIGASGPLRHSRDLDGVCIRNCSAIVNTTTSFLIAVKSNQCACIGSLDGYTDVPETSCNSTCADGSQCGGSNRNFASIYRIDPGSTTTTTTTTIPLTSTATADIESATQTADFNIRLQSPQPSPSNSPTPTPQRPLSQPTNFVKIDTANDDSNTPFSVWIKIAIGVSAALAVFVFFGILACWYRHRIKEAEFRHGVNKTRRRMAKNRFYFLTPAGRNPTKSSGGSTSTSSYLKKFGTSNHVGRQSSLSSETDLVGDHEFKFSENSPATLNRGDSQYQQQQQQQQQQQGLTRVSTAPPRLNLDLPTIAESPNPHLWGLSQNVIGTGTGSSGNTTQSPETMSWIFGLTNLMQTLNRVSMVGAARNVNQVVPPPPPPPPQRTLPTALSNLNPSSQTQQQQQQQQRIDDSRGPTASSDESSTSSNTQQINNRMSINKKFREIGSAAAAT
ncbi:hypothetical protein HK102_004962, partial [Quaeritorhiza haematococci]